MTEELKHLIHDIQELAGMPAEQRQGSFDVATARAVIKKFFALGLSLGESGDRTSETGVRATD